MKPDGGPAFPIGDQSLHPLMLGMSLRDWFAGMALQGMIASSPIVDRTDPNKINKPGWAKQAYGFADAMLTERQE